MSRRAYLNLISPRTFKSSGFPNANSTKNFIKTRTMSTFTIPDANSKANAKIELELCAGLSKEELLKFPAFKHWFGRLQKNLSLQKTDPSHVFNKDPFTLKKIQIQSLDRFGESIGFIKLYATVSNKDGPIPGAIFLRGPSVGMLVILQPDDLRSKSQKQEKYVLMTVQPRVPTGGLQFLELPAGMVDDGTFRGKAAKEIEEELDLIIPEDELINMTELAIPEGREGDEEMPKAMFPSAGGCDECIQLFLHEKRVPRNTLEEWTGKHTGVAGEKITLKLVKLEDLWKEGARDSKALSALALWEALERDGTLERERDKLRSRLTEITMAS